MSAENEKCTEPTWNVKEKGEEVGWIRVEPNYHDQLVPEPGQKITLVQEPQTSG